MSAKCPNHDVPLQMTNERGIGICPISGYRFEFAADEQQTEVRYDKFGKPMVKYQVKSLDGPGG